MDNIAAGCPLFLPLCAILLFFYSIANFSGLSVYLVYSYFREKLAQLSLLRLHICQVWSEETSEAFPIIRGV